MWVGIWSVVRNKTRIKLLEHLYWRFEADWSLHQNLQTIKFTKKFLRWGNFLRWFRVYSETQTDREREPGIPIENIRRKPKNISRIFLDTWYVLSVCGVRVGVPHRSPERRGNKFQGTPTMVLSNILIKNATEVVVVDSWFQNWDWRKHLILDFVYLKGCKLTRTRIGYIFKTNTK